MTIRGTGTAEFIHVTTTPERFARLHIEEDGRAVSISIDANHLQALEMAVRAARLELEARAVGP